MPNTVLLRQLAAHLLTDNLGHKHFSIANYNTTFPIGQTSGCGTVGCAIGECPIVWPEFWYFEQEASLPVLIDFDNTTIKIKTIWEKPLQSAIKFFGISKTQAKALFVAGFQGEIDYIKLNKLNSYCTKENVAYNINLFCDYFENQNVKHES